MIELALFDEKMNPVISVNTRRTPPEIIFYRQQLYIAVTMPNIIHYKVYQRRNRMSAIELAKYKSRITIHSQS